MSKYHIRFAVRENDSSVPGERVVSQAEGDTPEELLNNSITNWDTGLLGLISQSMMVSENSPEHVMGCMTEGIAALDNGDTKATVWTVYDSGEASVVFTIVTHETFEALPENGKNPQYTNA